MQDESADIGGLFDGFDLGGQWLSRHPGLLLVEFDTDQEEQGARVIGGGEGIQQGIISAADCDREHQCRDKGVQNYVLSLSQQAEESPVADETRLCHSQRRKGSVGLWKKSTAHRHKCSFLELTTPAPP